MRHFLACVRQFIVLAAILAGACASPVSKTEVQLCAADTDCGAYQKCNVDTGQCLCATDEACGFGASCNVAGFCQPRLGCVDNADCGGEQDPNVMCDVNTDSCVSRTPGIRECTRDSQCGFGSVCEAELCTPGCRKNGDCPLGQPCIDGSCDPTPGACNTNALCESGQLCDDESHGCVDHAAREKLCSECDPTSSLDCDGDCLIDTSIAPTLCESDADCPRGFCGSSSCYSDSECGEGTCDGAFLFVPGTCSISTCQGGFCGDFGCDDETNPCPNGYYCDIVRVVSGDPCTVGSGSAECGEPRSCSPAGENQEVGYCSCADDGDCPSGTTCVDPGPNGSCIIDTTCAPLDGLVCVDLR